MIRSQLQLSLFIVITRVTLNSEFLPQFEEADNEIVTITEGDTAVIRCKIGFLNNESVSWIREQDSHIISVDQEIFISDDRFVSNIQRLSNLWMLKIRYASARDAGSYECQVSTVPKMSKIFHLKVVIPKVDILGGPTLYIQSGSYLQLECMISHTLSPPQFVMWEHGGRVVPGNTVTVTSKHEIVTKSVLTIDRVTHQSAGTYFCLPDNISPATINISIVNNLEEQMAVVNIAMSISSAELLLSFVTLLVLFGR